MARDIKQLIGQSLCLSIFGFVLPASAENILVQNVKITSVEELIWTAAEQAVFITYSGDDVSCLARGEQRITFKRADAGGNQQLQRISDTALQAFQTGANVHILGKTAGDCYSANAIVVGAGSLAGEQGSVPEDVSGEPKILSQKVIQMDEDTSLELTLNHFNYTNAAPGSTLVVSPSTNYTVTGQSIKPQLNFPGQKASDVLTVPVSIISDGKESEVFNATVTVNNVNDPPYVLAPWTYTIKKNTSVSIYTTGFFSDPDGRGDFSTFTYQFVDSTHSTAGKTTNGKLVKTAQAHVFTYTPKTNFVGKEAIKLWVTDSGGLQAGPTTIYVDVTN